MLYCSINACTADVEWHLLMLSTTSLNSSELDLEGTLPTLAFLAVILYPASPLIITQVLPGGAEVRNSSAAYVYTVYTYDDRHVRPRAYSASVESEACAFLPFSAAYLQLAWQAFQCRHTAASAHAQSTAVPGRVS